MSNLSQGVQLLDYFVSFLFALSLFHAVLCPPQSWRVFAKSQQRRCHWNKDTFLRVHFFHLCFLKIYQFINNTNHKTEHNCCFRLQECDSGLKPVPRQTSWKEDSFLAPYCSSSGSNAVFNYQLDCFKLNWIKVSQFCCHQVNKQIVYPMQLISLCVIFPYSTDKKKAIIYLSTDALHSLWKRYVFNTCDLIMAAAQVWAVEGTVLVWRGSFSPRDQQHSQLPWWPMRNCSPLAT